MERCSVSGDAAAGAGEQVGRGEVGCFDTPCYQWLQSAHDGDMHPLAVLVPVDHDKAVLDIARAQIAHPAKAHPGGRCEHDQVVEHLAPIGRDSLHLVHLGPHQIDLVPP